MIVVFAAIVSIAAFFWTLNVRAKDVPEPIPVSPIQHLEDRKQAIYENLRDLQFEFRLGKLSDEDYQQTKKALQRELAGVLAEIEDVSTRLGLAPGRSAKPVASVPTQSVQKSEGSLCPHCGTSFAQKLKYCGECGKAMA
jgi:hypothetical protein